MAFTVADYILQRLSEQSVDALFGVPAAYCAPLFDAAIGHGMTSVVTPAISRPATRPMGTRGPKGSVRSRLRTGSER